mgnify:CR=1 FL=1
MSRARDVVEVVARALATRPEDVDVTESDAVPELDEMIDRVPGSVSVTSPSSGGAP